MEDFILKPYTIDHLKDALRKTMEQLQQKQNEKKGIRVICWKK